MIFDIQPLKDTYVNNLKLQSNNGENSNVGFAATLDIFKLYNENKHSYSKAYFNFDNNISDDDTLIITDSNNIQKTFKFKVNEGFIANNLDADGTTIKIGLSDLNNQPVGYANRISDAINAVNDLKIIAYYNSNNDLVLKQENSGDSGDTPFSLPTNGGINDLTNSGKFSRIDYSSILIKFDIESFKNKFIENYNNSSFNDIKAYLILKDVTTGISKPKNYELEVYRLLKDFDEGIGKDTVYFSEEDSANFVKMKKDGSSNWSIPSFISKNNEIDSSSLDTFSVINGDENIKFDVTNYIDKILDGTNTDHGLLIKFKDEFLFNNISYFVKRLGSRHLLKKNLIPELSILINSNSINTTINKENVKKSFNSQENFYLQNYKNGILSNIYIKQGYTLKTKIVDYNDNTIIYADNISITDFTNIKGSVVSGIKKATITDTQIDFFNQQIQEKIKNDILKTKIIWFAENDNDANDFIVLYSENVEFHNNSYSLSESNKNIITVVKFIENEINSDGSVYNINVYFIDPTKNAEPVRKPLDLPSLNIGEVFYSIIDIDTNEIVTPFYKDTSDKEATKLFFDGEKYTFNLHLSNRFKNKRINFKFLNYNSKNGFNKTYENKNMSFRIN